MKAELSIFQKRIEILDKKFENLSMQKNIPDSQKDQLKDKINQQILNMKDFMSSANPKLPLLQEYIDFIKKIEDKYNLA